MITISNIVPPSPEQFEAVVMGMRNPKNSWDKSDSFICKNEGSREFCDKVMCPDTDHCPIPHADPVYILGPKDKMLMQNLCSGGSVHAKFRRQLPVIFTVTAPLYWWKEFNTYTVGTCEVGSDIVSDSCSTMHKIMSKPFTLEDFSYEDVLTNTGLTVVQNTIDILNKLRSNYLKAVDFGDTDLSQSYWRELIQLLPTSYNQTRTISLNYEVLANMYFWRNNHKLVEWRELCKKLKDELPYSFLFSNVEG